MTPALAIYRHATPATDEKLPSPILALKDRLHEAVPITAAERQHRVVRASELLSQDKLAALIGASTLRTLR